MPGWSEILAEFQSGSLAGETPDSIRRRYIRRLAARTGRPVIVYATAFLTRAGNPELSITMQDIHGFMEACRGLPGPNLDLILHSPGGIAEATASLVHY